MINSKIELPPTQEELDQDDDARRAEMQFLAIARGLVDEGMPMISVVRGLADSIIGLIDDEHMKGHAEFLWVQDFLREIEAGFGDWRERLELIGDLANEIERSRAAGGTGNPFQ
ncbi:hypothetical protein [Allopusillimonas ginsengisoli]|uniref:hypothetical protein n=1 Tax=Allopusillimonas ginsengisoli TaxID=453575 RepID=UPI00101EA7E7|nr:hypothetical protein [Allopusillimonas ginsengisoli]TEA79186.1 hypothetical protein ERE07_07315 [Allopusillimonas ginsengisoli]